MRCLPRSRGVPTSFYGRIMIVLANPDIRLSITMSVVFDDFDDIGLHLFEKKTLAWKQGPIAQKIRSHPTKQLESQKAAGRGLYPDIQVSTMPSE